MNIHSVKYKYIDNCVNFTSYNKINPQTNLSVSTSFYNDYPTLKESVALIESNFPKGADILVYAGSNGEEAISVDSLLKHPNKYNIFSIDPYKDAIQYAKNGIYAVNKRDGDGFLFGDDVKINSDLSLLKKRFNKSMKQIPEPKEALHNMTDFIYNMCWDNEVLQKYYQLRSPIKNRIQFVEGDIRNISDFKTSGKKVGAIFFRNALYHLTNNDFTGVFNYGEKPVMEINRLQILKDLVNNIDKKLSVGGIFVLGDHLQEHLYMADKHTPLSESILFDKSRNIRLMSEAPHCKALFENGNFKPVFYKFIDAPYSGMKLKMPLIWQKIK